MKVLLATDGSEASHEAEWLLSRLPFPGPIDLTIAHVAFVPSLAHLRHEFPASVNEILDEYLSHAEGLLQKEAVRFEGINGTVQTCLESGHTADVLVQLAEDRASDMVVIGARGQSPTKRLLLGSVSQKVVRHAPCSVLVTRPSTSLHSSDRPLRILVGYDGSAPARQAVDLLSRFHWGENVEITLLNVVTLFKYYGLEASQQFQPIWEETRQQAQQGAEHAASQLRSATTNVRAEVHEAESVAEEILTSAERVDADLIVLGHRGLNAIQRFLLGSTSETVLRHAPCLVWIVREDVDDTLSSPPSDSQK